jgi:hypothetical protein
MTLEGWTPEKAREMARRHGLDAHDITIRAAGAGDYTEILAVSPAGISWIDRLRARVEDGSLW